MKKLLFIFLIAFFSTPSLLGSDTISHSSWLISESNGHKTTFFFNLDGTCSYFQNISPSGNEKRIYDECKWIQNDKLLFFETTNHFAIFVGFIKDNKIIGSSFSNYYVSPHTFEGIKINWMKIKNGFKHGKFISIYPIGIKYIC